MMKKTDNASEAILAWFFAWVFVSCGLFWLFADRVFPKYGGAQSVSLDWVGISLLSAAFIAAGLGFLFYKHSLSRKRSDNDELHSQYHRKSSADSSTYTEPTLDASWSATVTSSIITLVVALLALGLVVYLVQPFH